jgi:hypothetical protein
VWDGATGPTEPQLGMLQGAAHSQALVALLTGTFSPRLPRFSGHGHGHHQPAPKGVRCRTQGQAAPCGSDYLS